MDEALNIFFFIKETDIVSIQDLVYLDGKGWETNIFLLRTVKYM